MCMSSHTGCKLRRFGMDLNKNVHYLVMFQNIIKLLEAHKKLKILT